MLWLVLGRGSLYIRLKSCYLYNFIIFQDNTSDTKPLGLSKTFHDVAGNLEQTGNSAQIVCSLFSKLKASTDESLLVFPFPPAFNPSLFYNPLLMSSTMPNSYINRLTSNWIYTSKLLSGDNSTATFNANSKSSSIADLRLKAKKYQEDLGILSEKAWIWEDRSRQWSTWPAHNPGGSEDLFGMDLRTDVWRTDIMCEYNYHYRPRLWVGRVDQFEMSRLNNGSGSVTMLFIWQTEF